MDHSLEPPEGTRIPVRILGATGVVGQTLVEILQDHKWFIIQALCASDRSAGKKYSDATVWRRSSQLNPDIADMEVQQCEPRSDARIAFSGLDASVAGEIETSFAQAGYALVSNSKNHRMESDVPLLIPEVNPDHLDIIQYQNFGEGCIVTNPNCSTIGIAMALKPLHQAFGVHSLDVTTLQGASGAGIPGVPSIDLIDNTIPHIPGEAEKIRIELKKILGTIIGGNIVSADMLIDAQCNRVPVSIGHSACMKVRLCRSATLEQVRAALQNFQSPIADLNLPTAPSQPLHFCDNPFHPQPRLHRDIGNGMAVSVGPPEKCEVLDVQFTAFFDNLIRGAAGAAVLNAELLVRRGLLKTLR
ncbi:aspartate-semialdehyde dehydrogenase [Patescibacteria group bacterium]|nr:aspartate-semialdehyde dehydrogenase [Patescibacteria group bacterium]MBU2260171.1 aspartate-semialdehyde dehydrogenase [Patescibacteria group bacterium]